MNIISKPCILLPSPPNHVELLQSAIAQLGLDEVEVQTLWSEPGGKGIGTVPRPPQFGESAVLVIFSHMDFSALATHLFYTLGTQLIEAQTLDAPFGRASIAKSKLSFLGHLVETFAELTGNGDMALLASEIKP